MLRKLAAGTGAAIVAAGLAAAPAVASRLPHPGESCGDVPQSGQSGLDKVTTPADGSRVEPGDAIDVTLRWDDGDVDGDVLDRVLDCVQIDGRPAPGLSLEQGQVPNEGHLTHRYRIPAGLAPGAEVCDQGFVFGPPADVPQRLSSNRVCFTVAPPAGPSSPARPGLPAEGPPVPPVPGLPGLPGPGETPEAPGPPGARSPGSPGGRGPSSAVPPGGTPQPPGSTDLNPTPSPSPVSSGPASTTSPADFVGPAETAFVPAESPGSPPVLPLTGREARPLAAAGGANLIAAGLAFIGGARRRRRRMRPDCPPPSEE